MDIKEKLLELTNSETIRYSYMAVEKLIIVMMKDYLESQNKQILVGSETIYRLWI